MKSEELLEIITTEDVIHIITDLGSSPPKSQGNSLMFQTICHNGAHNGKHKLAYYTDNKFFQCLTNCGTMSIFDVVMTVKECSFGEAFMFVARYKNVDVSKKPKGLMARKENDDLNFLNNHLYKPNKQEVNLPAYNSSVMNVFDDYLPSAWIDEGISKEIMQYFDVKFYFNQYKGIIPHYDINGNLVGIQSRNFFKYLVNAGKKYVPISIQGLTYRYPTHFNLYGIYQNQNNIRRLKKAIIFESAKSVWLYGTYYGQENNIALASCGLQLSNYQRDLLLNLGIEEVTIAWDKQYNLEIINNGDKSTPEYKEYERFIKSVKKACGLFLGYCEVNIIFDWQPDEQRISYKDAPIDNGKVIFEELYRERYFVEDLVELEELV